MIKQNVRFFVDGNISCNESNTYTIERILFFQMSEKIYLFLVRYKWCSCQRTSLNLRSIHLHYITSTFFIYITQELQREINKIRSEMVFYETGTLCAILYLYCSYNQYFIHNRRLHENINLRSAYIWLVWHIMWYPSQP